MFCVILPLRIEVVRTCSEKEILFYVMICNSRRAVRHIDGAAAEEALPLCQVLHRQVIGMGIDADIIRLFQTELKCLLEESASGSVTAHAVYGAVWLGVSPCAAFDDSIGWIFTEDKGENASQNLIPLGINFCPDIAVSVLSVLIHLLTGGIAVDPLGMIPVLSHKTAGRIAYFHDAVHIFGSRWSDIHVHNPWHNPF